MVEFQAAGRKWGWGLGSSFGDQPPEMTTFSSCQFCGLVGPLGPEGRNAIGVCVNVTGHGSLFPEGIFEHPVPTDVRGNFAMESYTLCQGR